MTKLELYNAYKDILDNIYQIFVSVFKAPFVDRTPVPSFESIVQGMPDNTEDAEDYLGLELMTTIKVHFPKITIENEFGKTHDIYDMFIMVKTYGDGRLVETFDATRTSFTVTEIKRGYVHSHFPRISQSDILKTGYRMCLGTGPIVNTTRRLRYEDYDESLWLLFCTELGMYLETESIKGGPYIRMSELGSGGKIEFRDYAACMVGDITSSRRQDVKKAVECILDSNLLKFSYYNGKYCIGEPFESLLLKTSALVEKDDTLPTLEISYDGLNVFRKQPETESLPRWYEAAKDDTILVFKGKNVKLKLIETKEETISFKVMHPDYVKEAINIILILINNYYETRTENTNRRAETESASKNKHIEYRLG